MVKRLQEYLKYSLKELETYTRTEGSCIRKVNTKFHLTLGAYALADFKQALLKHLRQKKVGYYDQNLNGIILDLKNIKLLGTTGALRADDSTVHININADCYVFQPQTGAVLSGLVKHIGKHHVGVIIYRVYSAHIQLEHKICEDDVQLEQEVKFRIKNFNLQNVLPYIQGELLVEEGTDIFTRQKKINAKQQNKIIKFTDNTNDESIVDSGIEEKESEITELDELLTLIKQEIAEHDEEEQESTSVNHKKVKKSKNESKRKRKLSEFSDVSSPAIKIKQEIKSEDD